MAGIVVPKEITSIEKEIEDIKFKKEDVIKQQRYEEAARLRDDERQLKEELDSAIKVWEDYSSFNRINVTEADVSDVVSMMSGIPLTKITESESSKLATMGNVLKEKVVGQDEAVDKIVRAIQRSRSGLKSADKPIGSFFFLGSTGVGKTELTKVLAEYLFDSEDALIRVDMSEYMEKFSTTRLMGAPPGYVGYEEGGQLTEKVRRKPYSIVLLDEIEKAHPDILNMLLQVLDDGHMTDGLGRKVNFKNTIIIMTSNIGARQLSDFGNGVGFGTKAKEDQKERRSDSIISSALKKAFSPEFLNRVDDMIMFKPLEREHIHSIIDIELGHLFTRINELGYKVKITDAAKDHICERGYDEKFGARPLKRSIQKLIEDPLAEQIVNSSLKEGDSIVIDYKEGVDLKISIRKSRKK
tara:strand:- start:649 stop:1884 length:1236 start_codon:yes stop_codon:yes gene_type:complete